jgi:hypothetical protein
LLSGQGLSQTLAGRRTSRLEIPHAFRVVGVAFLLTMALGRLPALFALPASTGDITTAPGNRLALEGHDLVLVDARHADTDDSSVLDVPDLGLVVAGDAIYRGVHQYLGESADERGSSSTWTGSLPAATRSPPTSSEPTRSQFRT